jgi:UDP-glucose 4-epimerase
MVDQHMETANDELRHDGMHVCLLGGNGFIGSYVLDELLKRGHRVLVYDRRDEKYRKPQSGVEYIYGDGANYGQLLEHFSGVDCVVHLISSTVPESSNQDPIFDVQSNLVGTLRLLQACVQRSVKRVVFVSSGGTVYGIPRQLPIPESHPNDPLSSYGIVKLAIEKYLALYARLYNIDYRILRPSNPYGERQDPLGTQGIISVYLWQILHGQPVVVYGDGSIVRDYLYASDLSRAVCMALEHRGASNTFNVGFGQGLSISELIDRIRTTLGCSIRIERRAPRPFDVPQVVLDISYARAELNWQPQVSIEEGLRRTSAWLAALKRKQTLP